MDDAERLLRRRYVSCLLRLLIEPGGALVSGEVLGIRGGPSVRFKYWDELVPTLRAWVEQSQETGDDADER